MNKPGGTAWILSSHIHDSDLRSGIKASISYDVKYVLHGQSDRDVPETFVEVFQELERKSRKRGIETVLPLLSPIPQKKEKRVKIPKELSPNIAPNVTNTKEIFRDVLKSAGCTESLLSSKTKTPTDNNQLNVLKKTDDSTFKKKTRRASTQLAAKHGIVKINICISHTSLEVTDFAKLEKFLTRFSASHSEDCGALTAPRSSSLALSSSSSTSSSSAVAPILMDVSKALQHVETRTLNDNSGLRLSDKFDESVTHLIVSTDKKGVLRKRTLKFMQAIMGTYEIKCSAILCEINLLYFFLYQYNIL